MADPNFSSFDERKWRFPIWFWIGLALVGIVVSAQLVRWIQAATTDEHAEAVKTIMDKGLAHDDAECIVDGLEERFGSADNIPETRDALTTEIRLMLECLETFGPNTSELSECMVDAFVQTQGDDFNLDSDGFVDAVSNLDSRDRRFLTEASMVCQGAPEAVARCVVETMLNEFGADLFDAESLILTPDQQSRLEPIQFACLLVEA